MFLFSANCPAQLGEVSRPRQYTNPAFNSNMLVHSCWLTRTWKIYTGRTRFNINMQLQILMHTFTQLKN